MLTTTNPVYLFLALLVSVWIGRRCRQPGLGWHLPWPRLTLILLLFPSLFNMASLHTGHTVLWSLPAGWVWVGGPWTLEAFLYGTITGLLLLALLVIFSSFNQIVGVADMVRLMPPAFQDVGVVLLIALTYLPQTAHQVERVRSAQAVRGHKPRGWRDWVPLVVPVLVASLERAMSLAEAMVARGYGHHQAKAASSRLRAGLAIVLLLGLGGWFATIWWGAWGGLILLLALSGLAILIRYQGRGQTRTEYHARPAKPGERWLKLLMPTALLLFWQPWWPAGADYMTMPRLTLPAVSPPGLLAIVALGLPGLIGRLRVAKSDAQGGIGLESGETT